MKAMLKTYFLFIALLSASGLVHAQSTAFTYNGRLHDKGLPVNGTYEMRFTLFDVAAAGNVVAGPLPASMVEVANGLFTVRIDFGANVFTGPARWLEVAVRQAGAANFTTLAPRQEVTSSPYAIRAQTAGTAMEVNDGVVVKSFNGLRDGVTLAAGANVTITPAGNTLTIASSGVGGSGIWSVNGNNAFYNAGNVGIGTNNPQSKLSVRTGTGFYGLTHTDGAINLGSYVGGSASGASGGWLGTLSTHPLHLFVSGGQPSLTIDTGGNVGIGTISPFAGYRLSVNGSAVMSPGGRGGGNISFSTPNGDTGITINGPPGTGNRADLRFDDTSVKLLAGPNTGPPPATSGVTVNTLGYVGIGKASATFKLDVFSDTTTAIVGRSTVGSGIGVYGESSQFSGVQALGHHVNHAALVGVHDGGGVAIYGTGASGVNGESTSAGGFGGFFVNRAGGIGLRVQGTAQVDVLQILGGADVAEPFELSASDIAKGSVVVIDEEHPGKLQLSTRAYDTRVAGIVSGANGVNPGITLHQEGVLEGGQNVALSGRVYVRADATHGAIKPGDLLTTSDTPGHAMKVADHGRAQGAILGKAMSALKEGKGMVLVLVTLQ